MTTESERELLAYDLSKIDCLAQLKAWQAPWNKCWTEISALEERWPIEEIEQMVDERARHPDYHQNKRIPYPENGWIEDMLRATQPGILELQVISLILANLGRTMSHDIKSMFGNLTETELIEREEGLAILKASIEAYSNYRPKNDRNPEGERLLENTRRLSLKTLEMALASLLYCGDDSPEQIAQQDLQNFSSESLAIRIKELIDHAQETAQYMKTESAFGSDSPDPIEENNDAYSPLPDPATRNDTNPKHLLHEACETLLRKDGEQEIAAARVERAFRLLPPFIDPDTMDLLPEQLKRAAREYKDTEYIDDSILTLSFLAESLSTIEEYELARQVILLELALMELDSKRVGGYEKDTDELFCLKPLGYCLMALKRYEDAVSVLERSVTLCQACIKTRDITGRALDPYHLLAEKLKLWICLKFMGQESKAMGLWKEIRALDNFSIDIDGFFDYALHQGQFEELSLILEQILEVSGENTPETEEAFELKRWIREKIQKDNSDSNTGSRPEQISMVEKYVIYLEARGKKEILTLLKDKKPWTSEL